MEMTLNVKITGLDNLVAVLERLTTAPQIASATTPVQVTPNIPAQSTPDPVQVPQEAPVVSVMPVDQPIVPQAVAAAVPVAQPTVQVPVAPATATPQAAPSAVPTTVQTYTQDQLALAASTLVDAGRFSEVQALVASFGVQALTQLPRELYGAFATQLRALGAKI